MSSDVIWQSAPSPALHAGLDGAQRTVRANAAALRWAALHGVPETDLLGLAARGGAGRVELAGQALQCTPVSLADGTLWWLQPCSADPQQRQPAQAPGTRRAAEALGVGFWSLDMETGRLQWDDELFRIYGRDPQRGAPTRAEWIDEHVHPLDRDQVRARIESADARWAQVTELSFRVQAPDNAERWVQSWTCRAELLGRRTAYGMHTEVTAQRSAQLQAQRERRRAQLALDAAGVGVWERDREGRVLHWNEAMYRLRDVDAARAPSPDELMDRLTHPEDRIELHKVFLKHISSGQPYRQELRVKAGDGQWRWLLSHGQVMRDEAGQPVGMAGINIDITERKRAAELALENDRIEQASRDKSAFMARMSHELRTPMNAVLGFARLIEGDAEEPPSRRQRDRLRHISQAGQELMLLIDDLLETARREVPAALRPVAGALHVLCVEDNPVNLQLVRELLALRPAVRLRTAEDGTSGLAAAHAEAPDLLLLDVHLPDINGVEVMRRLRAEPSMAGCRIVALSADAMPDHIEAALAAGFDDYWTKPIQFEQFLAGIDAVAQGASRSRSQPLVS